MSICQILIAWNLVFTDVCGGVSAAIEILLCRQKFALNRNKKIEYKITTLKTIFPSTCRYTLFKVNN